MSVDLFRLNEQNKWELTPYAAGDILQLSSVQFECSIDLIYEDVELLT
jgi:Uma2 family endonuclease